MTKNELETMLESLIEKKINEQVEKAVRNIFESGLISTIIKETAAGVAAGLLSERRQVQPELQQGLLQSFSAVPQQLQTAPQPVKRADEARRAFSEYSKSLSEKRYLDAPQTPRQPSQNASEADSEGLKNVAAVRMAMMEGGAISEVAPRGVELSDFMKLMKEASKKPKMVMSQG